MCIKRCFPAVTAVKGLDGLFPYQDDSSERRFGNIQAAGEQFLPGVPKYLALRDVVFVPTLLDTLRVKKMDEIGAEPLYIHVNTQSKIGELGVSVPLIMAAMGSTDVANVQGLDAGLGAAKTGTVYVIGENVMNMRGYDERTKPNQPTLKERILSYLKNSNSQGGVVIQQNVEDARAGVWKRIYSDPELKEYFKAGLIGFEAKGGQGAKPGMGGEVKVDRDLALKLKGKYYFPDDPEKVEQALYQRHSVPGTMTAESMKTTLEKIIEEFPDAHLWFKTGPYGDLTAQIQVLDEVARKSGKRINLTIDGAEGGTGMSPMGPMNEMGLPTLVCLEAIAQAKERYNAIDYTIAGGLFRGDHLAKALALGADVMAIGRGVNIA
ncbi:MAG: glutamate synthase-related protein, partial [Nitrosopumilus sp.]